MRAYARKQKMNRRTGSSEVSPYGCEGQSGNRKVHSILLLQRRIGNLAVQRMMRADAQEREKASPSKETTADFRFFKNNTIPGTPPARLLPKLTINTPGDMYEVEADRIADQVMQMQEPRINGDIAKSEGCRNCRATAARMKVNRESVQGGNTREKPAESTEAPSVVHEVLGSPGRPLEKSVRDFFEPRFGRDFSGVRIHTDARASTAAQSIRSRAFASGNNIAFNSGQFAPKTMEGKRLLGHELAHVIQQRGNTASGSPALPAVSRKQAATPDIQRATYKGKDHGGRFTIDDKTCEMDYYQKWYFKFKTKQTKEQKAKYMEVAKKQIEETWSEKYPLIPDKSDCPCHPTGLTVKVHLSTVEDKREGKKGFSVAVHDKKRAFVNPLTSNVTLDKEDAKKQRMNYGLSVDPMPVIPHEFGHTIGLPDEYTGWAGLFRTEGSNDKPALMHYGADVRPRHYQPFADLANLTVGKGCTYRPGGLRFPHLENPVSQWSGFPFPGLPPGNVDFILGLNYDQRISNTPLLGLMYPTVGMMSLWNPADKSVNAGPSAGLRLNRLAHPLYLNIRTGLLFDPALPSDSPSLNIPISTDLGIQKKGFKAGVNYTALVDVLNKNRWTHVVGIGFSMDLP